MTKARNTLHDFSNPTRSLHVRHGSNKLGYDMRVDFTMTPIDSYDTTQVTKEE